MRKLIRPALVLALLVLGASACGSVRNTVTNNEARAILRVENQNFLDMTIYVYNGAQRVRLGTVPGLSTRRLNIPGRVVFGVSTLRFQADPIGGSASPLTEEVAVSEGDEIVFRIPA